MSSSPTLRHQGPLEKQGKLKTWTWKKYWFSLQDAHLVYMKEEVKGASRKRNSSSHGEINMNEAQCVKECHNINHGFPFQIATKSRTHILSAESSASREEWIDVLRQAMLVKSRKSTILSESRDSGIPEVGELDDGAYESVMGSTMTSASKSLSDKPALTMTQSEMEPRCRSEYIDDGNYDAVFDAVEDQHPGQTENNSELDEDDNYAEVVNAIRPGKALPKETEKQESKKEEAGAKDKTAQPEGGSASYSYVEMRTKTAKDYMKKDESLVDDYADVYGNESHQTASNDRSNDTTKVEVEDSEEELKQPGQTSEAYAKVIPKTLRQTKELEDVVVVAESEEDYDDVEVHVTNSYYSSDTNNNAGNTGNSIQDLPYPRLELITDSAFDDIRRFLALNRGPSEVFKTPPNEDLGGKAVEKLRQMLLDLEDDYDVLLRPKVPEKPARIIESTHL